MENKNEIVDFLKSVPLFSEVSKNSLSKLSELVQFENFFRNELILEKGTPGDAMYVIIKGKVKIHGGSYVFNELGEKDSFGEFALIENSVRSATVTSIDRSTILKIESSHFWELMKDDYMFANSILSKLIKRHRELDVVREKLNQSIKELELANVKMQGLIDGAMDAIIMFDKSFKIILTNPSANALLENDDVHQRNILFFFDEKSAHILETIIAENQSSNLNTFLPEIIKVVGSNGTETLNEGTLSKHSNSENYFYTLILRNIEDRIQKEDKITLLTNQTEYLEEEIKELTSSYGIIAEDVGMKNVLNLIDQVAKTDATVLIQGETGTGKELVARAIHKSSNRNDKPLVRVNCGAIPENLIESELFGHKKGAFTGATNDRKGRFQLADKGTIFLDEIGELPLNLQPKLLRVIQEGEFDPVGSSETIKVDVRIIAATHRDLLQSSREGKFREDLYYRLNVFPLNVPPLRSRGNDIILIAQEMLNQFSAKLNKQSVMLSDSDKELFLSYSWPGNVRELQNLIERGVIVSTGKDLNWLEIIPAANTNTKNSQVQNSATILTSKELLALEKENILKALKLTKWKISGKNGAAQLLDIKPTTLNSKIKVLGIERPI